MNKQAMEGSFIILISLFTAWIITRIKPRNDRLLAINFIAQPITFPLLFRSIGINNLKIAIKQIN